MTAESNPAQATPQLSGQEALHHAHQAIADAILASADDAAQWGTGMHAALGEMADILNRHRVASERQGGSIEEMATLAPRLVPQLERAAAEHQPLIERTEALRDTVAGQLEAGSVDAPSLRREVSRLQADIDQHLAAGVDLMYEAYERDMGGEG